jgi:hypothetical protein
MPYMRARSMGGGTLICFEGFTTREECEAAIAAVSRINPKYPPQFVVHLPHLEGVVGATGIEPVASAV